MLPDSSNSDRLSMLQQCTSAPCVQQMQESMQEDQSGFMSSDLCHCVSVTATSAAGAPDSRLEVQTQAPP